MLDFKYPELSDNQWITDIIKNSPHLGCVYSFALAMAWHDYYNTRVCLKDGALLFLGGQPGDEYYLYPIGEFDTAHIITELEQDALERGIPMKIVCAEPWQLEMFRSSVTGDYEIVPERDDFDYIYSPKALIELAGRKYHGKRNHISKFTRTYPDWVYEPITAQNIAECKSAVAKWYDNRADAEASMLGESKAVNYILDHFDELGQTGGVIRVSGEIVALTIGEAINDDLFVTHFEKALPGFEEAYTVINREFAAHELSSFKHVNREEDMGLEGLRKAKLSYYPEILIEK